MSPIRTYEAVIDGQAVTVSVYPPQVSTPCGWANPRMTRMLSVDNTVYEEQTKTQTERLRRRRRARRG